jgi:proton glutamate symport protein
LKYVETEKKKGQTVSAEILYGNADKIKIDSIISVQKIGTIATYIRPLGTLFIRLLSFLAIPLVISSLIIGAASLGDIKKLGRIGGKTLAIYITTTAIAITIGLVAANVIEPGMKVDEHSKNRLAGAYQEESAEKMVQKLDVDVLDFLVNIVPRNPIKAMATGNMLQIVFFAVMFGVTLTFVQKQYFDAVSGFFNGVSETMIKMVDFVMAIAPYGVFAIMAATIADFGFEIIMTLFWYMAAVIGGLMLQTLVLYPMMVKFIGKMSPLKYLKGIRNAQIIGFSTSSSAATLPVTMECAEKNLGLPKQISGFVLPLGATINMDGTALYQGVAAVFIAQVFGIDLSLTQQLTVVFTAVLASIGTAPVPGVGLIMLVMILQAVNIPPEGIALILGVDRILDMCRTVTNVSGDVAVAVSVAGSEMKREIKK